MFEDARHFPGGGWHARDGHDRMPIDLEDFIGAIVDDCVARRRTSIAGDEDATLEFKSENGRRLGLRHRRLRWDRSHRSYRPHLSHATQQPDEILSSAPDGFHHWPVRWR